MRRILLLCTLLSGLHTFDGLAQSEQIRILPLGDSITQGGYRGREEYTYRYPLARILLKNGVDFDFIGSTDKGLHPDATWPDIDGKPFDADHEGHYGWKTAKVRDQLAAWMETYADPPDVVLIHLGTNDQRSNDFQGDIITPLREIVTMIRQKNPKTTFLIGHLNFNRGPALEIRPMVEEMAKSLDTTESPVRTVHHYQGWQEDPAKPNSDTFDWAHPNPSGQQKMANKWWETLQPILVAKSATRTD